MKKEMMVCLILSIMFFVLMGYCFSGTVASIWKVNHFIDRPMEQWPDYQSYPETGFPEE